MDFQFKDTGGCLFIIENDYAYYYDKKGELEDECQLKYLRWARYEEPTAFFKGTIRLMFPGNLSGKKLFFLPKDMDAINQLKEIVPHDAGVGSRF